MSKPDEDGRMMPNKQENALMLDLMMLHNTLAKNSEAVKTRLKDFPYAWRDMRLLWCLVNKLQDQLMATMPDRRVAYYDKIARYGKVIIDIPGPISRGRHILIDTTSLAAVTEAAMRGECAICLKTGKEVQRCSIRAALLEVAPPEKINEGREHWVSCEYLNAASALTKGKDVFI